MTVLIYVDTSKQVGDPDHLKVFVNQDAAETWFEEDDPEGSPSSMRFWNDRIGLTIETALAACSARAANLGGFLPVRDFREAQTGSFKPTPAEQHRSNSTTEGTDAFGKSLLRAFGDQPPSPSP